MADGYLTALLKSRQFLDDLAQMAQLTAPAYEAVVRFLATGDPTQDEFRQDKIDAIATTTGAPEATVAGLIAFAELTAPILQQTGDVGDSLKKEITESLQQRKIDPQLLLSFLRDVAGIANVIDETRQRRRVLRSGEKTLHAVYATCDLRLRTAGRRPRTPAEVNAYRPTVAELLPVITIRLNFNDTDDGDDCVFLLSKSEIGQFVATLQGAERELDMAMRAVTLRHMAEQA